MNRHLRIGCAAALALAAAGACFRCLGALADPSPATGTVEVLWDRFELRLTADGRHERIEGTNGRCVVPAGDYRIAYLTLKKTDGKGNEWRMQSGYWNQPLKVEGGKTARIPFRPPLTARLVVTRHRVEVGRAVRFGLEIIDADGRTFRPPRPTSRFQTPKPSVQLTDATGRRIDSFALEYG